MIYGRIDYDRLPELQAALLSNPLDQELPQQQSTWNATAIESHMLKNKPIELELFEQKVLDPNITPAIHETFFLEPHNATYCHRDEPRNRADYRWSINIPLDGYIGTHTSFWKPKGRPNKATVLEHAWSWPLERCTLIKSYNTTGIFVMDTSIPHSIHCSNTYRKTYMLRMPSEWNPAQHLLIDYK